MQVANICDELVMWSNVWFLLTSPELCGKLTQKSKQAGAELLKTCRVATNIWGLWSVHDPGIPPAADKRLHCPVTGRSLNPICSESAFRTSEAELYVH